MLKEIKGVDDPRLLVSEGLKRKVGDHGEVVDYNVQVISLAKKGEIDEALKILERENPRDYMKSFKLYTNNLRAIYMKERGVDLKYNLSQFEIPKNLMDGLTKVETELREKRGKSLVLIGPTGIAKTAYMLVYLGRS